MSSAQPEAEVGDAEIQFKGAINMSLEQPEAEVGSALTMRNTSLNVEDQDKLEKALIISSLSLKDSNEAVMELHHGEVMPDPEKEMKVIVAMKQALELTPDGHADKPGMLNNLGQAYQARFGHLGELSDIESAIIALKQAVQLIPDGHADKPGRLHSFGKAYQARFTHLGELSDIESAIIAIRQALQLTPDDYVDKPGMLNSLGKAYQARFGHLGDLNDMENAIAAMKQAVELTPDSHADKPRWLNSLGKAYQARFGYLSELSDETVRIWNAKTGEAIGEPLEGHTHFVSSVAFSPDGERIVSGSYDQTVRIWNAKTGRAIGEPLKGHTHFVSSVAFSPDGERIVSGSNDQTVRIWNAKTGEAIGEPLEGHTDYVRSVAFSPDGERIVSGSNDETVRIWNAQTGEAIGEPLEGHAHFVNSVAFSPDGERIVSGSNDKTVRIWNAKTGEAIGHLGELSDIESAILALKQAVELTPDGHADKPGMLNNLGHAYQERFSHLGELSDMESAIVAMKQAVELTPDGHPDKPSLLNSLVRGLQAQFGHLEDLSSIDNVKQAVELIPDGDAVKPSLLNSLSHFFLLQFHQLGKLNDIESAIIAKNQAVELTPNSDTSKSSLLIGLDTAIEAGKQAVALTSDGHAAKPSLLHTLGYAYELKFDCLGELRDINRAIDFYQQAVDLTPEGHTDRPEMLSNLGAALISHLQDFNDIERAISCYQEAVDLTLDEHEKASFLTNLGNLFQSRFDHQGVHDDIQMAIACYQKAADLTPDGHIDKPSLLNSLNNAFMSQSNDVQSVTGILDATLGAQQGGSDQAYALHQPNLAIHYGNPTQLQSGILHCCEVLYSTVQYITMGSFAMLIWVLSSIVKHCLAYTGFANIASSFGNFFKYNIIGSDNLEDNSEYAFYIFRPTISPSTQIPALEIYDDQICLMYPNKGLDFLSSEGNAPEQENILGPYPWVMAYGEQGLAVFGETFSQTYVQALSDRSNLPVFVLPKSELVMLTAGADSSNLPQHTSTQSKTTASGSQGIAPSLSNNPDLDHSSTLSQGSSVSTQEPEPDNNIILTSVEQKQAEASTSSEHDNVVATVGGEPPDGDISSLESTTHHFHRLINIWPNKNAETVGLKINCSIDYPLDILGARSLDPLLKATISLEAIGQTKNVTFHTSYAHIVSKVEMGEIHLTEDKLDPIDIHNPKRQTNITVGRTITNAYNGNVGGSTGVHFTGGVGFTHTRARSVTHADPTIRDIWLASCDLGEVHTSNNFKTQSSQMMISVNEEQINSGLTVDQTTQKVQAEYNLSVFKGNGAFNKLKNDQCIISLTVDVQTQLQIKTALKGKKISMGLVIVTSNQVYNIFDRDRTQLVVGNEWSPSPPFPSNTGPSGSPPTEEKLNTKLPHTKTSAVLFSELIHKTKWRLSELSKLWKKSSNELKLHQVVKDGMGLDHGKGTYVTLPRFAAHASVLNQLKMEHRPVEGKPGERTVDISSIYEGYKMD
ncbi:hypothetical protein BT96DRAFT_876203 [Gymnopus androsaceus JB14]|uniref:WD40 repeat-like protein n=1 Tax=Gymnopus androsaceus JB14 TaxID=1447944 RepID=A0A6A4I7S2_9AGAR|nr:hypothetical protein BT96DRAFT_876203 [Gymnopus androsaceus JB14]